MKNSGKIFIGIMAAATAGVIIGMLIAPEKGEDLRKNIRDTAGDWTKKLNQLMADSKDQFSNLTATMAEEAQQLKNGGKAKV